MEAGFAYENHLPLSPVLRLPLRASVSVVRFFVVQKKGTANSAIPFEFAEKHNANSETQTHAKPEDAFVDALPATVFHGVNNGVTTQAADGAIRVQRHV
jgi:hypothetical protein